MTIVVKLKNKHKKILVLFALFVLILTLAFCINTCIDSKSSNDKNLQNNSTLETTQSQLDSIESFAKENNLSVNERPDVLVK